MLPMGYLTLATDCVCLSRNYVYAYLTRMAMWDRLSQQRAYIGITRSCMRWYVRNNFLIWVKTAEIC